VLLGGAVQRLGAHPDLGRDDVLAEIIRDPTQLRALLDRQELNANAFWSGLVAVSLKLDFDGFVRRGGDWDEEVLIPKGFSPSTFSVGCI
jgi:hypothetical protein